MNYKDKSFSIEERIEDLLKRMTLIQKIVQLQCLFLPMILNTKFENVMADGIGEIAFIRGFETPQENADYIEKLQKYLIEETELGIPAIIHCEAISGGVTAGMTQFPSPIGLGASWNPERIQDMADFIRKQLVSIGIRRAFSPVLDISRDPCWV